MVFVGAMGIPLIILPALHLFFLNVWFIQHHCHATRSIPFPKQHTAHMHNNTINNHAGLLVSQRTSFLYGMGRVQR